MLPVANQVLTEAQFEALPGFELQFTERPDADSFLVGYNRFAGATPMYGRLVISGNPVAKPTLEL